MNIIILTVHIDHACIHTQRKHILPRVKSLTGTVRLNLNWTVSYHTDPPNYTTLSPGSEHRFKFIVNPELTYAEKYVIIGHTTMCFHLSAVLLFLGS